MPKCGALFNYSSFHNKDGYITCALVDCDFKIREKRYAEIVNSQVNKKIEDELNKEADSYCEHGNEGFCGRC